ncbi:MAG: ABC transporter substrate-binding protein [Chloroflexi bacterium]|nr:ABC transporter substrate-binding protein [Chloroflexota bacterium]
MGRASREIRITVCVSLCLMLLLTIACGDNNESENTSVPTVSVTIEPTSIPTFSPTVEDKVITIGNLTDITGVASNAMSIVNMALEDMIEYYNDENLIPGVELKVVLYDGQFDPAKDIPGYEWLKRRDADLIFAPLPSTTETLRPRIEDDGMVLFALAPSKEGLLPPGHAFCPANTFPRDISYTLLKWIAENDPRFPKDRPAVIGGAYWAEAYGEEILGGSEKYAKEHPELYEWDGGHLTGFTFTWGPEIAALKDCDYVLPPVPMNNFVKEFRDAGHKAKLIGTDAHGAFLGLIDDADLWTEVDEMLIIQSPWWWTEDSTLINLARTLLYENHSEIDAEETIRMGNGYISVMPIYIMLEVIADAVEAVGPEKFDSEALYQAAKSFNMTIDGFEFGFNESRRTAVDHLGMYQIRAAEEDVFRYNNEWVAILEAP